MDKIKSYMNDFQWVKDIDGISSDVNWQVIPKWHSKRLNRKFKKELIKWVHPRDLIKIKRVYGVINREFNDVRWVWIVIETNVGNVTIESNIDFGGVEYFVRYFNQNGGFIMECQINKNFTPQVLIEQLNKLDNYG